MRLALLLALQALPEADPAFDLATLPKTKAGCGGGAAGEIIVCGRRDPDRYRLKPLPTGDYAEKPVRAETRIGGAAIAVTTEQATVGNQKSNRAMVRLKMKF